MPSSLRGASPSASAEEVVQEKAQAVGTGVAVASVITEAVKLGVKVCSLRRSLSSCSRAVVEATEGIEESSTGRLWFLRR